MSTKLIQRLKGNKLGGRGSFSASHGGVKVSVHGAGSLYISEKKETRSDIRQMFINELGFKELYGTNSIPTAQLGAIGNALKQNERNQNILKNNNVFLSITNDPGTKGAAMQMRDGSMVMFLNPSLHSNVGGYRKTLRNEQKIGFKTKTDNKITNDFAYTARHEYGHLVQYDATRRTGKNAGQIRNEVQSIAKNKYNANKSNPSGYGSSNVREYFAESYASMTSGKPNAQGKAMADWLKKNGR